MQTKAPLVPQVGGETVHYCTFLFKAPPVKCQLFSIKLDVIVFFFYSHDMSISVLLKTKTEVLNLSFASKLLFFEDLF